MAEESFVEEAFAVVRRDDHRRCTSVRARDHVERQTDRAVDVGRGVVVHLTQLARVFGNDLRLIDHPVRHERIDPLVVIREVRVVEVHVKEQWTVRLAPAQEFFDPLAHDRVRDREAACGRERAVSPVSILARIVANVGAFEADAERRPAERLILR